MRPIFDPRRCRSSRPITAARRFPRRACDDFIRHRLLSPPAWEPELTDESRVYDSRAACGPPSRWCRWSSVGRLTVLLTERNANLTAHAGQISFGR
jgi:hypothetical protein